MENENGLFVLGCQLCRDKDYQEDWSKPGALWMTSLLSATPTSDISIAEMGGQRYAGVIEPFHGDVADVRILSANHGSGEVTLYRLSE